MKDHQASLTAKGAAVHRAIESEKPADQRICYDPLARKLIGPKFGVLGTFPVPQGVALWLYKKGWPGFHAYFAVRTRYIDEHLTMCIKDGIKQVVILGAGYDSRAYRFDAVKTQKIKVFEVDHPATQHDKQQRLREIFGDIPRFVIYVSIDFQRQVLSQRLMESGYDEHLKTCFIWEGVSYYLHPEAVDRTLQFVREYSGFGSSLIFDYTHPNVVDGTSTRKEAKIWHRWMIRFGEPLIFGIPKGSITTFMEQRGFTNVQNADSKFLKNTYFTGVNQSRILTPIFEIVHATT